MQRHVANGGLPYDEIGKSIIEMSEQIAQLKSFSNYVVRNDLMNSDTNGIVERSTAALTNLREQISRLAKQSHYEAYKENFQATTPIEVPDEVVEDFTEKFTVKNFKEDLKSVFPVLYKLMQEENTIGYDDIVAMTTEQQETNEDVELDTGYDPFEKFESWVSSLGEESALTSEDETERSAAVQRLQKLMAEEFPAGVDGSNAIESIKGIIEDPSFFKEIKDAAKEDPQMDIRPLVKAWIEENAREVLDKVNFEETQTNELKLKEYDEGSTVMVIPNPDFDETDLDNEIPEEIEVEVDWHTEGKGYAATRWDPAERPEIIIERVVNVETGEDITKKLTTDASDAIYKRLDDIAEDSKQDKNSSLKVDELAEFIHSFYDKNTGTFPKGPEGVCTMVGKKFGEQAENVARKFVERMAPQQSTEQNPELQELARVRELSGL
jgi:hypothetical protein